MHRINANILCLFLVWGLTMQSVSLESEISAHEGVAWNVCPSPRGNFLTSCGSDRQIRLWALSGRRISDVGSPTGTEIRCLGSFGADVHCRSIRNISWCPRGYYFAAASFDSTVSIWAIERVAIICDDSNEQTSGTGGETTKDCGSSEKLASAGDYEGDCALGQKFAEVGETEDSCRKVEQDIVEEEDRNCVWRVRLLDVLVGHESEAKSVAWDYKGKYLSTCSRDKSVWVYRRTNHNDSVSSIDADDLTSDGDDLSKSESLYVDKNTSDAFVVSAVLTGHTHDVKYVRWHPSRNLLASASFDTFIILWGIGDPSDHDDWVQLQRLGGHSSTVWCLCFIGNGDKLFSASGDGTIRLWRGEKIREQSNDNEGNEQCERTQAETDKHEKNGRSNLQTTSALRLLGACQVGIMFRPADLIRSAENDGTKKNNEICDGLSDDESQTFCLPWRCVSVCQVFQGTCVYSICAYEERMLLVSASSDGIIRLFRYVEEVLEYLFGWSNAYDAEVNSAAFLWPEVSLETKKSNLNLHEIGQIMPNETKKKVENKFSGIKDDGSTVKDENFNKEAECVLDGVCEGYCGGIFVVSVDDEGFLRLWNIGVDLQ